MWVRRYETAPRSRSFKRKKLIDTGLCYGFSMESEIMLWTVFLLSQVQDIGREGLILVAFAIILVALSVARFQKTIE